AERDVLRIVLLGKTGAGKSSSLFLLWDKTMWRDSPSRRKSSSETSANTSLKRLCSTLQSSSLMATSSQRGRRLMTLSVKMWL
uniref:AIG1-type G domain-containing protein n=1 Tax=Salarias fasciatus TaxID=181472 RepID=A0A672HLE3_SALFA